MALCRPSLRTLAPVGLLSWTAACAPPAGSVKAPEVETLAARSSGMRAPVGASASFTESQRARDGAARLITRETDHAPTVGLSPAPLVTSIGPAELFQPKGGAVCPPHMVLIGERVCIDQWEAHVVVPSRGERTVFSPFESLDAFDGYRAESSPGTTPQGYISGKQAELACHAAGKRLCTSSEWERGCRGPKKLAFPYGAKRRAHVCNDDVRARHPVVEAAKAAGLSGDTVWLSGMNLPSVNQLPDTLFKTGSRPECVTEEGLFDMVGNLHEWVADADGTFRGGYYMDTTRNGDGCSYQTTAHDFGYHDYSTGFRCCADPEPIE